MTTCSGCKDSLARWGERTSPSHQAKSDFGVLRIGCPYETVAMAVLKKSSNEMPIWSFFFRFIALGREKGTIKKRNKCLYVRNEHPVHPATSCRVIVSCSRELNPCAQPSLCLHLVARPSDVGNQKVVNIIFYRCNISFLRSRTTEFSRIH